jgi:hypothetical protein
MHPNRESSTPLSDAIEKLLASPYPNDPKGRTWREFMDDRLVEFAAAGKKGAAKELVEFNRRFGSRPKKA